jgi:hypothetical protein
MGTTFASFSRLFRREPVPSPDELASYGEIVFPALERAEEMYRHWFDQAALVVDGQRLANGVAVHRWEAARLADALEKATPPATLARAHAEIVTALRMAGRAAQLLGSGSRSHNASAVCDGQTLLDESRARRTAAAAEVYRLFERPGETPDPPTRELVGSGASRS